MTRFRHLFVDPNRPVLPWIRVISTVLLVTHLATAGKPAHCSADPGLEQAVTPPTASNPHWNSDGCRACHTPGTENIFSRPVDTSDTLCLACHDGKRAKAEDHPVGRSFSRPDIRLPDGFPAPDNKLACLTCHDVLPACRVDAQRQTANSALLRGSIDRHAGTYCSQCHIPDTHRKHNPHVMVNPAGQRVDLACLTCHTDPIPTAQSDRTNNAALRLAEPDLCLGCHGLHEDYFEPGHPGAAVTDSILAQLLRTDQAGGTTRANQPQWLPLTSDRRVVCSTCHNPHQSGVFQTGSVLDRGAMSLPKSALSTPALRLPGKELCNACHGY